MRPCNDPLSKVSSIRIILPLFFSSDIEMADFSQSKSKLPQQLVEVDIAVTAAYKPGPQRLTYKSKQYIWKHLEDNCRAFTKPSIIWQLRDECRRTGSNQGMRYWRCELCKTTTLLAMTDNSSTGLRHLKKKRKIDENGQRIDRTQSTVTAALRCSHHRC